MKIDQGEAGAAESKSIDLSFGKIFDLGAIASISTLEEQCVIDSEPKEEFIGSKITDWRPYTCILQNSNGHGGLNF